MFDVGFWELVMIGLVALVVIGPERLPRVARTVGLWAGRARGFLASVKADIDRELNAQELRRVLEEQKKSTGIHDIVEETRSAVDEARGAVDGVRDELRNLDGTAEPVPPAETEGEGAEAEPSAAETPSAEADGDPPGAAGDNSEGTPLQHESTATPNPHHEH